MILALLFAVTAAPPPAVAVVVRGEEAPLVAAAAGLAHNLSRAALTVDGPLVARPAAEPAPLVAAEALFDQARTAYAELDAPTALTRLTELGTLLRPWLDADGVAALLARSLRLRGLVHQFAGDLAAAAQSFTSAAFLDPEFTPAAEEWPPEARLAYADALADVRRAAPAALSVRVEPAVAEVIVDGIRRGVGSLTVSELAPGAHHLTVVSAGYERFAALVALAGDGRLEQVDVFLQPLPAAEQREQALAALHAGIDQADEVTPVRQAAALLAARWLVFVAWDAHAPGAWRPAAWLFDAEGRRIGGLVALIDLEAASDEFERRILGLAAPPPAAAARWYEHWAVWAGGGVLVAGGVALLAAWLVADDDPRGSFYLGGRR